MDELDLLHLGMVSLSFNLYAHCKKIMVKFLQRLPLQLPSTWSAHFEFVFFFFLGKICHFIDGLQHSPFYRWKSRCCFFFNDSYTNHYFMRIMFSLWGQSTWSIYQIQGSQIYILQHNVYSSTGSATHLAIIIFWKQHKTENFENM